MSIEKRRMLLFVSIGAIIAILITVISIAIIKDKKQEQPAIESSPIETAPIIIVEQEYIRTSAASWKNSSIVASAPKDKIKEIRFVKEHEIAQSEYVWAFDGFRCSLNEEGIMFFITGSDKVRITSLSLEAAFANLPALEKITGTQFLDLSNVKNINRMFENSTNLQTVDLNAFNFKHLVSINGLFYGCTNLKSADLSCLDLQAVTEFIDVFNGCKSIESISLPALLNVYQFDRAFKDVGVENLHGCVLKTKFQTSECYSAIEMFKNAKFSSWDFAQDFDVSNLQYATSMFEGAEIDAVDLSKWNTAQLISTNSMFKASTIEKCSLANWDMSSMEDMSDMFYSCGRLKTLHMPVKNVMPLKSTRGMFYYCYQLSFIDLSSFDNLLIGNTTEMFSKCYDLQTIVCEGLTCEASENMFIDCKKIQGAIGYDVNKIDGSMANLSGYFRKEV